MKSLSGEKKKYQKIALKQPSGFTSGIYFNLPEEEYHADCALSHSGMVDLLKHPYFYWANSGLNKNGDDKRKKSAAMEWGRISEEYLLDPEGFRAKYRSAYESYDPNRATLPPAIMEAVIKSVEALGETKDVWFQNGYPQVSFFWIDPTTRLRMRARFDYLLPFGGIDLKRIREITDFEIGRAIANFGYDIQNELYIQGMRAVKEGLRAGTCQVYGEHDAEWLKAFIKEDLCGFGFLFQRSEAPFVYRYERMPHDVLRNAAKDIENASLVYLEWLDKYGAEEPWPCGDGEMREFPATKIPMSIHYRGNSS